MCWRRCRRRWRRAASAARAGAGRAAGGGGGGGGRGGRGRGGGDRGVEQRRQDRQRREPSRAAARLVRRLRPDGGAARRPGGARGARAPRRARRRAHCEGRAAGRLRDHPDPRGARRLTVKRMLRDLDWLLLAATVLLVAFGMVALASATVSLGGPWSYIKTRLFHLAIAPAAMVAVVLVEYRRP